MIDWADAGSGEVNSVHFGDAHQPRVGARPKGAKQLV